MRGFVGVGLVGAPPNLFVVSSALPVKNLRELIDLREGTAQQGQRVEPGYRQLRERGIKAAS